MVNTRVVVLLHCQPPRYCWSLGSAGRLVLHTASAQTHSTPLPLVRLMLSSVPPLLILSSLFSASLSSCHLCSFSLSILSWSSLPLTYICVVVVFACLTSLFLSCPHCSRLIIILSSLIIIIISVIITIILYFFNYPSPPLLSFFSFF